MLGNKPQPGKARKEWGQSGRFIHLAPADLGGGLLYYWKMSNFQKIFMVQTFGGIHKKTLPIHSFVS